MSSIETGQLNGWSVEQTAEHDSNSKRGNGWEIFRRAAVAKVCSNIIGDGNINDLSNGEINQQQFISTLFWIDKKQLTSKPFRRFGSRKQNVFSGQQYKQKIIYRKQQAALT